MARGTDANAVKFSYKSKHTLEHIIWLEIGFTSLEAKVLKDNLCSNVLTICVAFKKFHCLEDNGQGVELGSSHRVRTRELFKSW